MALVIALMTAVTTRKVVRGGLSVSIIGLIVAQSPSYAQSPDFTKPPMVVSSAGPFAVRRLTNPPAIDDRQWLAADVQAGYPPPRAARVPRNRFLLTFMEAGTQDTGEFERYRLLFQRRRGRALRIDQGFTAWVYVTPDSRYIVTEPLFVLDVDAWTQYPLHNAFIIPNYTSVEAISRDGKRLIISRSDCVLECPTDQVEYFELTLRR